MRLSRIVPVLAAGALLVASTSPVHAQSADPVQGVGTTTGDLSVLALDAGNLLALDLLSDTGETDTAGADGARRAAASLSALTLESELLGISESLPVLRAESTDGTDEDTAPATPLDSDVTSGSLLPGTVRATVDEALTAADVLGGVGGLDVLHGVLSIDGADLSLAGATTSSQAEATRGLDVGAIEILDLGTLLAGLGIELTDLSLETLLGLVDGLGLGSALDTGALLAEVDGLLGDVEDLLAERDLLEGLVSDLDAEVPLCDVTDPAIVLLGQLLGEAVDCTDPSEVLESVLDELDALLDELDALLDELEAALTAPLALLDGLALVSLQGADLQVLTRATHDVDTSVATITGGLGTLQVGDLVIGGLDLAGPLDGAGALATDVDAVLAEATATIGDILSLIAPALGDLVTLSAADSSTGVVDQDGTIVSTAEFSGLLVALAPITDIGAVLDGLGGDDSLGALLDGVGLPVPASGAGAGALLDLADALDVPAVLSDGLTMRAASVTQQATFTPVAAAPGTPPTSAPTPGQTPTLPRTGSDDGLLLALAGLAVLAALGGRQLLRRSEV